MTWEEPSAGVTGYRVLRDGVELARVGADVRKFEDRTARAATLLASSVEATQGTERAGIKVTWLAMGEGAVVAIATSTWWSRCTASARRAPPRESAAAERGR